MKWNTTIISVFYMAYEWSESSRGTVWVYLCRWYVNLFSISVHPQPGTSLVNSKEYVSTSFDIFWIINEAKSKTKVRLICFGHQVSPNQNNFAYKLEEQEA